MLLHSITSPSTSKLPFSPSSSFSSSSLLPQQPISRTKPEYISNFHFPLPFLKNHQNFIPPGASSDSKPDISSTPSNPEQLQLLEKPPHQPNGDDDDEATLASFLKFLESTKEPSHGQDHDKDTVSEAELTKTSKKASGGKKCFDPKPGDFVLGVVVSGDEHKIDIDVAADELGLMLTKEALPLPGEEMSSLLCDFAKDGREFAQAGRFGIVKDEDAFS